MKALSLWQPWATLVEIMAKENETRGWPTSHRGSLAIHAAKTWSTKIRKILYSSPFFDVLRPFSGPHSPQMIAPGGVERPLPFGAVVCVVDLWDCVEIRPDNTPQGNEQAFGNYNHPGRFMWKFRDIRPLSKPLPITGRQGLFEIDDNLILPLL